MMGQSVKTGGSFFTEADAWALFDQWVERTGKFKMFREVIGEYIQPRPGVTIRAEKACPKCGETVVFEKAKTARIDRVLIPLPEVGWEYGALGVEGKRSDQKAGPLVCQAIDYSRCLFKLRGGATTMLGWIFIYPFENPGFDLGSIMVNNRIGYIPTPRRSLLFRVDETNAMAIDEDGSVRSKALPMGNKAGSR